MTLRPEQEIADEIIDWMNGRTMSTIRDRIAAALTARTREVRAACKAIATDRFDMPPEHEGEAVAVHNGWEMCARTIAARIAALEEEKP